MKISEVTRRSIFDAMTLKGIAWSGRLTDLDFLGRLFNLSLLPSDDRRFNNAYEDIWQHCVMNPQDWSADWVYSDPRFDLLHGEDEVLLRFLCETLHPIVRADADGCKELLGLFNERLKADGFEIVEKTRISGRPVYVGREMTLTVPVIAAARNSFDVVDESHAAQLITRMEVAASDDPGLAIGTAKELVESCCKTILEDRSVTIPKQCTLSQLVKLTSSELQLTPQDIPEKAKAADTIKRLLNNLATITQGIAELRNAYGTGHGKSANSKGLQSRHAKLAVGAASTLVVFLIETHKHRVL